MSEQESNSSLFLHENSRISSTKILVKLLPNGYIHVDWRSLPKQRNARQYVIHYKSLNTNRSEALSVSRKEQEVILRKIQFGHVYEIHVCIVDRANRILASSEPVQIQTKALDQAPTLRVTKSTPDFIWLEWEKSEDIQLSDIESYRLNVNGETHAILLSTENRFVINEGEIGRRYIVQVEMNRKDGKTASSSPVHIVWPGVTVPQHHVFINGCEELIICWGNSKSINDGNIESYTLHLYDSEQSLLKKIGPNTPDCHQLWIKDVAKGVYYYVLEIQLAHSKKSLYSKPRKIECGRETRAPILSYKYADSNYRERLSNMAYRLIKIRDNIKSNRWQERCEIQLKQILSTFANLTDSLHLILTIESQSGDNKSQSYQLLINDEESMISIPGFTKTFPLDLPRRDKHYELSVMITPDAYATKSNKVFIEASGQLPFFCAHFNQHRAIESCSYQHTLSVEKHSKHPINQGSLKSPEPMNPIQVYDLKQERVDQFPPFSKGHRLSIVLFYLKRCVPSITHLNYFDKYASTHPAQYNFTSINCDQDDLDELKEMTQNFHHIQCLTDFSPEEFEHAQKGNDKPIYELLSLHGVPTYFILNFSGRIVWKRRLCIQDQSEYGAAMDHIITESQQQSCSSGSCELCSYRSMEDARIDSELKMIANNLQSIANEHTTQTLAKQQDDQRNRKRRIVSMKT